ncbi:MAG: DUF748 domain-containing protein [Candidatus Binatia bacterium]
MRSRWGRVLALAAAVIALVAVASIGGAYLLDEPARRWVESTMNSRLDGYTITLPEMDVHLLALSATLRGFTVVQDAHPEPPIVHVEVIDAGVHWRALLHWRLVLDVAVAAPRVHIDRRQLQAEAADAVPIEDKGWQAALQAVTPIKINQLTVTDGAVSYIDADPERPLRITQAELTATNIRNVRSPQRAYPSELHLKARLFDAGRVTVDGAANFLSTPHAGAAVDFDVEAVPLDRLQPVAAQANVHVKGGILATKGRVEYAPTVHDAHLALLRVDDVSVDYVHSPATAKAEARRAEQVKQVAADLADAPDLKLAVDELRLARANFGFVDQTAAPAYRLSLDRTDLVVREFSNQVAAGPTRIEATGYFMGSGASELKASFLPRQQKPELDIALQIEATEMRALNDLLQAYGDFDVNGGEFSLYTQISVRDRRIDGYVKPLFADLDVYDRRQDADKALFNQLYEGLVGGVAGLLENRREQVGTKASVSGRADQPQLSTLEVVINLVRNAFFRAILPGFDEAVRNRAGEPH